MARRTGSPCRCSSARRRSASSRRRSTLQPGRGADGAFRDAAPRLSRRGYFGIYAPELRAILERRWQRLVDLQRRQCSASCATPSTSARRLVKQLRAWRRGREERAGPQPVQGGRRERAARRPGRLARTTSTAPPSRAAGIALAVPGIRPTRSIRSAAPAPFTAGLCALDLLFNCGPASRQVLLGESERAAALPLD